ncbi:MAG: tRNA (adenosine(37)-N6)-threonylcarbamoyltransferase complex dimerization subunit type 1 TsaB [Bacteroidales bacterium]|nr:tRNA (adenosine(37)-N6)-threonylcarbamoyltransferase complex dimerization subunit type 1 TsaB [Bacteroidales bacterium]
MALILCIETATEICSIGLIQDGKTIELRESSEEKTHASHVSVFIEDILKKHAISPVKLDAVAVSMGPGSYTGLRIGVSVCKGICYGASVPLIGINTLQSLSWDVLKLIPKELQNEKDLLLCPMLDARRMEVYSAFYDSSYKEIIKTSADIITPDSYSEILDNNKVIFFGNGSKKCKDVITHPNALFLDEIHASSQKMAIFAEKAFQMKKFEDVAYFEPFYLKDFQTTIPKNKLFK